MERGGERLSKYERDNLLIKLEKEFAFAGAIIPAEIEADGERIRLRSIVFAMSQKRGSLTPEDLQQNDVLIAKLRRKKKEIVRRIAIDDIGKDEAMELYRTALGLDRALDTLYRAPEPKTSVKEESKKAGVEDMRRWLGLVRRVYTKEEKRKRD
jgi:hypothetical protein